jgi:hypothetical protein
MRAALGTAARAALDRTAARVALDRTARRTALAEAERIPVVPFAVAALQFAPARRELP